MKKIVLNLLASLILIAICCFLFLFILVGGGTLVNSGNLTRLEMWLFNFFLVIVPGSVLVSIALLWLHSHHEEGYRHFKWVVLIPFPVIAASFVYYLYLNYAG